MGSSTRFALLLALLGACRATEPTPRPESTPPVRFENLFEEPDHPLPRCQKEAADFLTRNPDGVLFFDADSTLRIRVPSAAGQVPYHVHLLHRVETELVDRLATQGPDGTIELPLSAAPQPELLVVTSATVKMHVPEHAVSDRTLPLLAPYALAFRLVPRDQAAHLMSLQPFRHEWKHPRATVTFFVQSLNRSDMLLTLSDPEKGADYLFADGGIRWKGGNAALVPRVVVEVAGATGKVWNRAGAYPVPDEAWAESSAFDLHLAGISVVSFDPPPRVDLSFLDERPATSVRVSARFSGTRPPVPFRFLLAAGHPVAGEERVRVRVVEDEIAPDESEDSYLLDFSDVDPAQFPMTGYVAHRFVEGWKTAGGRYVPCSPVSITPAASAKFAEGPAHLHLPVFASHFSLVTLLGKGRIESELPMFLGSYLAPKTAAGRSILPRPIPVPWPPIFPSRPVTPIAVPVGPPVLHPTGTISVPVITPVDVVAAAVRSGLRPVDATFESTSVTLRVPTTQGLVDAHFEIRTSSETSVVLPQGLEPVTSTPDDPNAGSRAVEAGLPILISGRSAYVPAAALWQRPATDSGWRSAYVEGVRRDEDRQSLPRAGGTFGMDFWPGFVPPKVSAAGGRK